MGTIRTGANGGFSGKAGSIIGSSWRDINYIKGLPKISNKPKTEKQLEQQARFAMAVRFLQPVKTYLNVGFNDLKQGRSTGFNIALKKVLENAIRGVYPDLEFDYGLVEFAKGGLSGAGGVVILADPAKLVITWANDVLKANSQLDDRFTVLVYEADSNDYVVGPANALRSAGTVDVAMPSDWVGKMVHVFVYFISRDGKQVSSSTYAGSTTVM